jgi:hypothetical protein
MLQTELDNRELRVSWSRLEEQASMNDNNRRGYITGQTIAAHTKNLKGDISLAALDAPVLASLQAADRGKGFLTPV